MPICLSDPGQLEDLMRGCHISRGLLGISHGRCIQEADGGGETLSSVLGTMVARNEVIFEVRAAVR